MITAAKGAGTNKTAWIGLHATCGWLNWSPARQNCHHFADDVFWCIFVNENVYIVIKISLSLFLSLQSTITQFGLNNNVALNRRQAIIWTNADPIRWRIYAAIGGWGWGLMVYHHGRFWKETWQYFVDKWIYEHALRGNVCPQAPQVYYHNIWRLA